MTDKQPKKKTTPEQESPSFLEKRTQTTWYVIGAILVVVVFVIATFTASQTDEEPAPPPRFTDTTPADFSEHRLGEVRRELRDQRETIEEQREQQQRMTSLMEDLQSELGEIRSERNELRQAIEDRPDQRPRPEPAPEPEPDSGEDSSDSSDADGDTTPEPPRPDAGDSDSEEGGDSEQASGPNPDDPGSYVAPQLPSRNRNVPPPPDPEGGFRRDQQNERESEPRRQSDHRVLGADYESDMIELEGDEMDSVAVDRNWVENPAAGIVPMGAFADIVLLTGLDAGASERNRANPQPVLMRFQDDAILPGDARYRFRDCFGMGSGYGNLSSERAHIRLTRIACVDEDTGVLLESEIQGYVADSDASLGLRGRVVRRSGAVLGKAVLAGFAEGMANILGAAGQTQQVTGAGQFSQIDPDQVGETALGGGVGRAAEIAAEQYIAEAESMFPIIEIEAGRRGTVIIQTGQKLEWQPYEGAYVEEVTPNQ